LARHQAVFHNGFGVQGMHDVQPHHNKKQRHGEASKTCRLPICIGTILSRVFGEIKFSDQAHGSLPLFVAGLAKPTGDFSFKL
jgi:hypothetical protein